MRNCLLAEWKFIHFNFNNKELQEKSGDEEDRNFKNIKNVEEMSLKMDIFFDKTRGGFTKFHGLVESYGIP